jgi:hypothetical protein
MIVPAHVTDIKAAMETLKNQGYVSNYTKVTGYTPTATESTTRYQSAIDWASQHNHVAISNGPFYLESYDSSVMFAELRAFRDPTYPFVKSYWQEELFLMRLEIRKVDAPTEITIGENIPVDIYPLLKTEFPTPKEDLATSGYIKATLKDPSGVSIYSAVADFVLPGLFSLTIPSNVTAKLSAGVYTLDVSAAIEKGLFAETSSVPIKISIPKYSLTIGVSPMGKGETSPGVGTVMYEKGSNVTVKIVTTEEGYEFDYWELDGVPYSSDTTVTLKMDEPHALVAYLKRKTSTPLVSPETLSVASLIIATIAVIATAIVALIILPRHGKPL